MISSAISVANNHILTVYFSGTGNTKPLAEYASVLLNSDIMEIEAEAPYKDEDIQYCTIAALTKNKAILPCSHINKKIQVPDYDTIIIDHPIWCGLSPRIIYTFLESTDFTGKTLTSFCTSISSELGNGAKELQALTPNSHWLSSKRFAKEMCNPCSRKSD